MMFDYTELLGTNYYYEDENIIIVNMFSQNNYVTEARQTIMKQWRHVWIK